MPDTGALVAGWLGDEGFQPDDLRDPGTSLRYGARFLAWLLERYDGRVWPALAAYNAGPGPVDGWLEASDGDMDVFLELIDYPETSSYLRGVAVASALYRWRWAELR
jgi:soluble lytic murein transglycosylase